ncbi:hypothetical protein QNI19_31400 [Cytophagaceae bacterium DM2B3-1]|uniref:DUF4082 domain-containing protein n=1 Tax=Xanthocytophaga flava TaxID=3048013 RepID=A0ABT7CUR8_9BACT|nr:hypothetical protein [Xanthocytophaga flavus]MDJ1469258.1 hypothetical protein [Xanthocytophaga flavus]MDJ1497487.1 hypothetical protein [Xanthocytophaga flavus]
MRKTLQFSAYALLGLTLLLGACKKDDEVAPTETPFATFMADSTTTSYIFDEGETLEVGYTFKSSKTGKIVHLGTHMPKAGSYQVTLWDVEAKKSITQVTVTQSKDATSATANISEVALTANKEYAITVYNNGAPFYINYLKSYTEQRQTSSKYDVFPVTKGNITFVSTIYGSTKSTYPELTYNQSVYGFPEFGIRF